MNENQKKIFGQVQIQLANKEIIKEEDIEAAIDVFRFINPISDEEASEVKKELLSSLQIKMDLGVCLKEKNHVSWYFNARKGFDDAFWERYKTYLNTGLELSNKVIATIDSVTDEMMDMLGDPRQNVGYSRKGLIIGDVQSGKTSTYTALINKAADAGYKIIILLTGTIEKLRKQTQERLDAGFIGLDSSALLKDKKNIYVGVGSIDPSISGWSITSTGSDFNKRTAQQFNGQLKSIQSPVIFVLKKNKSVLEKLYDWLKTYNANTDGHINSPMLLIDDEADNASVNTKKENDDPTAINKGIRNLLSLFTHNNYVAFTATPYANIFINPDTDDEMLKDDLFPSDFIYALEAPTNYIGAQSIFEDDGKYHFMLKNNNDCKDYVPEKHKKDFKTQKMQQSLKEAICSFFISNVIRDLRGSENSHRTMLINISRFIDVQEEIKNDVEEYVKNLQIEIKNYSHLGKRGLNHEGISFIKCVFDKHFLTLTPEQLDGEQMYSWEEIQDNLDISTSPIVVRTVNGGNAAKNLNYDDNKENGLRLIAIGGFSLSRGLTLEGLCTSYFHRNSRMYDTLMQMGRWFGYRNHYADLCQIWMTSDSVEWYKYISRASEELKCDVRRMMNANLTPKEFGLCVRSDVNSLIVTAINKMRYTETIPITIGLDGSIIDTPNFYRTKEKNYKNYDCVVSWLNYLLDKNYKISENDENLALPNPQILNVDVEDIIELLNSYDSHFWNFNFRTDDIVKVIKSSPSLKKWDVLIASGNFDKKLEFGPIKSLRPVIRQFYIPDNDKDGIRILRQRISTVNYAKGGLTKEKKNKIEEKAIELRIEKKDKNFSDVEYFNTGIERNPLLVILPVILSSKDENKDVQASKENFINDYVSNNNKLWVGLEIGIPGEIGKKKIVYTYTMNMIKYRELLGADEDYFEETGVDDND
jgi:hypothetical protein